MNKERLRKPGWRILGLLLLVGLLMTSAWGVQKAARSMAFFRVRNVEVRGTRYLDPKEIVARLKVDTLRSLWDNLDPLADRIRRHPQISSVSIGRKMPGTLVVTIDENLPVALVQSGGGLKPFDSLGHQLPIDPARAALDLPIVATDDPVLLKLVGAVRSAQPKLFSRIQEARRTGRDEILLTLAAVTATTAPLDHEVVRVRVPLGLSVERLADIFPVESDLARRQARIEELDLRYRDQVIARIQ
jgi:cell division septal protein FtsQ